MPDEWSASPVTLTDAGDWASWTITLGSGDASDLNDTTGSSTQYLWMRYAMSAANRTGRWALTINDTIGEGIAFTPPQVLSSSAGWTSAGRFKGGSAGVGTFAAIGFPLIEGAIALDTTAFPTGPWVAGANTVRFLWYGRADDEVAEPVQIDFIAIQTQSGTTIIEDWGNGGGDGTVTGPDLKPVTGGGYTGYDDLGQGDQISAGSKSTWLLKGDDASTGTATDTVLQVVKFCPPTATIRVTDGSLVTGVVGAHTTGDAALLDTLDGSGEATFTIDVGEDYTFWYAGNDGWTPAVAFVDLDERIGCGGWHVGYIAIGA